MIHFEFAMSPALTVAIALIVGIFAQSLARHLRLPGIVLLLGAGILLGPDVLNIVRPELLGESLHVLVGYAVAVILFEGGLNLRWRHLRQEASSIRRLVSAGAVITMLGGAVAARHLLGWGWTPSILFGSLVIVTGPTVITPLLRRIKVKRKLETVLEAEGVLIDAVGAIVAVVTLEIVVQPEGASLAHGVVSLPWRLFFGALFGLVGGALLALLLRWRRVVPEGLENVFTLALALAVFQLSNAFVPETGIVAVVLAGIVVGNTRSPVQRELREFKEQLTVLLVGMLFVLLAADVRHADAVNLGRPGLLVVVALMFIVRPLNVFFSTLSTDLNWRERFFLAWLAPRGIVAAAVATLFDERLTAAGITGGHEMRALVFLVIAVTVLFQGLSGGLVARWLGVRRPSGQGYVILGANFLARLLGHLLQDGGEKVVFIDANAESCRASKEDGLTVIFGNAMEESVQIRAELDTRKAVIGALSNEGINLLFARKARSEAKVPKAMVAIQRGYGTVDSELVHAENCTVLFAEAADLDLWDVRVRRGLAVVEPWRFEERNKEERKGEDEGSAKNSGKEEHHIRLSKEMQNALLPLAVKRNSTILPVDDETKVREGDLLFWLVFEERREASLQLLAEQGWVVTIPAQESESSDESKSS